MSCLTLLLGLWQDICNRLGLDMVEHVLPYLLDEDEEKPNEGEEGNAASKTYTHEDYVRGAEECLLIEEEMIQMEEDDPDYLAQLEREALAEDPELVAGIISDVLKQDDKLLKEITSKLLKDTPDVVKEMEGMLGEGEELESRPDVVGFIIAKLLSDEENLELLDEFDEALSDHFYAQEWGEDESDVGGGDEL